MKMPSIFKPKSVATGVVLAGVILTPFLSHGCSVNGSSPESGQTVSSSVSHQSS
ncbi:MAG: hypothetical protein VCB79_04360 [Dehalococcoidia bacterium]